MESEAREFVMKEKAQRERERERETVLSNNR